MAADVSFGIEIVEHDHSLILRVTGEVDLATAPILQEQLELVEARAPLDLLVDLDQVDFMDVSGLNVLVAHAAQNGNGTRLRLTRGSPQVRHLFVVTGVIDQLPFASE